MKQKTELNEEELFRTQTQFWHTMAIGFLLGFVIGLTFGVWMAIKFMEIE